MNYLNPYNFFFELPLYTPVIIDSNNKNEFLQLVSFNSKIEGYNPVLKQQSTFIVDFQEHFSSRTPQVDDYTRVTRASIKCLRDETEFIYYFKLVPIYKGDILEKINLIKFGQYPSIADLHISQIKEYKDVLPKEKLKEFTKAIGLSANGVGIGAFVYLRRIFEYLIEEAHVKAKVSSSWNEEKYLTGRMNEKINLLKNELPEFLVENRAIYSILSKGIHELEEDECLSYFTPLRTGIEIILDEKIILLEKKQKLGRANESIKQIAAKIKGST